MRQLSIFLTVLVTGALLVACDDSRVKSEISAAPNFESRRTANPTRNDSDLESANPDIANPAKQEQALWPDGKELLDEQGFVEVAVTPMNLNAGDETLNFSVGLNTHSVDLSMDLAKLAFLETDNGLVVQGLAWDAPRGGHHVSGVLSFPRMANGKSILSSASQLTLVIYNVDAPERVFTWDLAG